MKSSKKIFTVIALVALMLVSITTLVACKKKKQTPQVEVDVQSGIYYVVDSLPKLSLISSSVEGNVDWVDDQQIQDGTHTYTWEFIPNDTKKYEVVAGCLQLTKVDGLKVNETITETNNFDYQDDSSYYYINCVITCSISTAKKIDLTFDNPYMFVIRDKDTGEVWFTGTVYEGSKLMELE